MQYGATSIIPYGHDPVFIQRHLGITNHFGFAPVDADNPTSDIEIVYPVEFHEGVLALLADYDAVYHRVVAIPAALDRVWALRKQNMARMTLPSGAVLDLDDTTLDRLTQASNLIDKARERGVKLDFIKWELVKGMFVTWPVKDVQDMAFLSGMHVQLTFAYQSDLYDAVRATTDAPGLAAVGIENGWPNQ